MHKTPKTEILDYDICALRSRHREVRQLKRLHSPSFHGFRIWPSSWLLMDFIEQRGMPKRIRLMEVGCGWGLAGIYCAKNHGAIVTCVDIDAEVFPYVGLHAGINKVEIHTMQAGFDGISRKKLKDIDVMIGSDICFLDDMVTSLKALILRALGAETKLVLIADPGRSPFETMGSYFVENQEGEIIDRSINHPYPIQGRLLKIGSLNSNRAKEAKPPIPLR
ncbi:methyltransferase [Thermodesulfobacteriota bacterium]